MKKRSDQLESNKKARNLLQQEPGWVGNLTSITDLFNLPKLAAISHQIGGGHV